MVGRRSRDRVAFQDESLTVHCPCLRLCIIIIHYFVVRPWRVVGFNGVGISIPVHSFWNKLTIPPDWYITTETQGPGRQCKGREAEDGARLTSTHSGSGSGAHCLSLRILCSSFGLITFPFVGMDQRLTSRHVMSPLCTSTRISRVLSSLFLRLDRGLCWRGRSEVWMWLGTRQLVYATYTYSILFYSRWAVTILLSAGGNWLID